MSFTIHIPTRFNGPPKSANGGVAAGLAAQAIDGPAEVSLRAPPPLDTDMQVVARDDGYECWHDQQLVMTLRPAAPLSPVPPAPSFDAARAGRSHFPPLETHAFPGCFVCGPDRAHDGLCIFAGRPDGFDGVTDIWTPQADLGDAEGRVRPEILWAALDCPGAFAVGFQNRPMVLARMSTQLHMRPSVGEELVVAGWHQFDDGRKHGASTAIFTPDGQLVAQSEQLWIELRQPAA